MVIEIRKVNFVNKGAELMLLAILDRLRSRYPDAKIVMQPVNARKGYPAGADYLERAKLNLYQKVHFRKYGIEWDKIFNYVPKGFRDRFGLVLDSEVDIVLDAAGFAYGDQQGVMNTVGTALDVKRWKKNNTIVIFMPQAFGPFKNKKIKKAFQTILELADRIFIRDKISYKYVEELNPIQENYSLYPDFTNLLEGTLPNNFNTEENKICIVPNIRMLDKTTTSDAQQYPIFMSKCIKLLKSHNLKPFFLIHEGKEDLELAKKIMKLANAELNIVIEKDPLKIKGIIGACDGMIGSRFHGLVNALSQGVPAIATGWSHKYEMLLNDYNFKEGLLSVDASDEKINAALSVLIDQTKRERAKKTIKNSSDIQKALVLKMWDEIYGIIDKKSMDDVNE